MDKHTHKEGSFVRVSLSPSLPPATANLQNNHSHLICFAQSSESANDLVGGGDKSAALTNHVREQLEVFISSINSNFYSSKRHRMGSKLKGDHFVVHHKQQMKLCTSDIPTNVVASARQRMGIAITKFMHSHMLPFTLTECPKFLRLL